MQFTWRHNVCIFLQVYVLYRQFRDHPCALDDIPVENAVSVPDFGSAAAIGTTIDERIVERLVERPVERSVERALVTHDDSQRDNPMKQAMVPPVLAVSALPDFVSIPPTPGLYTRAPARGPPVPSSRRLSGMATSVGVASTFVASQAVGHTVCRVCFFTSVHSLFTLLCKCMLAFA